MFIQPIEYAQEALPRNTEHGVRAERHQLFDEDVPRNA